MNLYMANGYVNISAILDTNLPFIFILGGRGTGKTYTTLKEMLSRQSVFMFMRRTQMQADIINKPEFSPYKAVARDMGIEIDSSPISKYNAAFRIVSRETVDGKEVVSYSNPIGYTCALSTISNIRGFDATDVQYLIYDEFIPESHERPIKNEGLAFLNAYETINRNRELKGEKPLQCVCLANSNDLGNQIFMELGIIHEVEKAMRKGRQIFIDKERGFGVFLLSNSPISGKKKETALYKISKNSAFSKMAIDNDFANRNYDNIAQRPINEYVLQVSVGELNIYRHKSNGSYYVSTHRTGTSNHYNVDEYNIKRFKRDYCWILAEYMNKNIIFEEVLCEILLTNYLG